MKKNQIRVFSIALIIVTIMSIFSMTVSGATDADIYQHNLKVRESFEIDKETLEFYKLPQKNIQSTDKEIIDLANTITKGIKTDYDKAKAIHDWVANNIWYDYNVNPSTGESMTGTSGRVYGALNTLKQGYGVCTNYAELTVALLRASNIPAKYVNGYALGVGGRKRPEFFYDLESTVTNHAWCEAYVDNRWVIIDTTWDSKNFYNKDQGKFQTEPCGSRFFDISVKDISATHKYSENKFNLYDFDLTSYTSITIPKSITSIGDLSFSGCINLEEVIMHDSVTTIGRNAFSNCNNLKSILIPNSVTIIGSEAFDACKSLKEVIIPDSVTGIGTHTFRMCEGLEKITLSRNLKSIGAYTFYGCGSLKEVIIPYGVENLGNGVFSNCDNLKTVVIPESVTEIGDKLFEECTTSNITIYGTAGSYAEKYAKENKIKFALISSLKHSDVLNTNITVSINGNKIPAYHIGSMAVSVEDLSKYGFIVDYQSATKAYSVIGFDKNKKVTPLIVEKSTGTPGSKKGECFRTDKRVYINGKSVNCYEYDGKIIILVSDLNTLVSSVWDGTKSETILTTK